MSLSAGLMTPYCCGNYTVNTDNVADSRGLDAVGMLLPLLNAAFVLLMVCLILLAATHHGASRLCSESTHKGHSTG